jgi:hypothetical protein
MKRLLPLFFSIGLGLAFGACASRQNASEDGRQEARKPGMMSRMIGWVPFVGGDREPGGADVQGRRLALTMEIAPTPVKLSETRTIQVTLRLANRSKKFAQLSFPTTQRIEVLLKNKQGKLVEQWSEDQAFSNEPSLVTVNPGERLEYVANVATRDLVAGEPYVVEGFFPNFEELRVQKTVVPEK